MIPYLFAALKSMIYGTTVFFTGSLTETVDVLDILALRFLMSFSVLWLLKVVGIVKIRVGVADFLRKNKRSAPLAALFLSGLFEPVLYMLFETLGISRSTNITTGVLLSLAPISTCICEALVLRERATSLQKLFLGLGIIGVVFIAVNTNTATGRDSVSGILFLLLAVVSGSLFTVFSRKSSRCFSTMEITYVTAALGMVAFNLLNLVRHLAAGTLLSYFAPYCSMKNLVGFFVLAVVSTIVATGMNNYALSRLQASTVSAFDGVSTLTTIAVGVAFAGERLYWFHWIGLLLILTRMIGVSTIAIRRTNRRCSFVR